MITTNYSKSDWFRTIPYIIITLIPIIFLILATVYLYLPYLEDYTKWLEFNNTEKTISNFAHHLKDTNTNVNRSGGFVPFYFMLLFGAAIFPLMLIVVFYRIIPDKWIIKKLNLEPRMKLVIFKNGKPVQKFRDLF